MFVCGEHSKTHTKSSSLKVVVVSTVMGLSMIVGGNALAGSEQQYSIYDATKSITTSDVTLESVTSDGATSNYAYTTGDLDKKKLTLTNINNPSTTATEFATEDSIYFSYNNENVSNALSVKASGITLKSLYGAYLKEQSQSSTLKGVNVTVDNSNITTGVFGVYSDIPISQSAITSSITNQEAVKVATLRATIGNDNVNNSRVYGGIC